MYNTQCENVFPSSISRLSGWLKANIYTLFLVFVLSVSVWQTAQIHNLSRRASSFDEKLTSYYVSRDDA